VNFVFRSGTEEENNQLAQLFEDIWTYRRDMDDLKMKEKEEKSRKEEFKKRKGQEMRAAAVNKMFSKLYASMCISHWKG
jgi:1,2-phenylacetyl-CoA epoxidase catalytic subunit